MRVARRRWNGESTADTQGVGPSLNRVTRLRVTATGLGMAPETLQRAFEPFFITKSLGMGTGLGLSTVRGIVTEAGGSVAIESRPGEATVMTRCFPMTRQQQSAPKIASAVHQSGARGHVLVVDDEPAIRGPLSRYLTGVGFRVSTAREGVNALDVLNAVNWQVALVLTDLVMPSTSGQEWVRQIQTRDPTVSVLCMSGTPGD